MRVFSSVFSNLVFLTFLSILFSIKAFEINFKKNNIEVIYENGLNYNFSYQTIDIQLKNNSGVVHFSTDNDSDNLKNLEINKTDYTLYKWTIKFEEGSKILLKFDKVYRKVNRMFDIFEIKDTVTNYGRFRCGKRKICKDLPKSIMSNSNEINIYYFSPYIDGIRTETKINFAYNKVNMNEKVKDENWEIECNSDDFCFPITGFQCINNKCRCRPSLIKDESNFMCYQSPGKDCSNLIKGKECGSSAFFNLNSVCECNKNYNFDESAGNCVQIKMINEECKTDIECDIKDGKFCIDNYCKCNKTLASESNCGGLLGGYCKNHNDCIGSNTKCDDNKCKCEFGFNNSMGRDCTGSFGSICENENSCGKDFTCKNNTCSCNEDMFLNSQSKLCEPFKKPYEKCEKDYECNNNNGFFCINNACKCDDTRMQNASKICDGILGHSCDNGSCYTKESFCNHFNCLCRMPFKDSKTMECLGEYGIYCDDTNPCHEDFKCKNNKCACPIDTQSIIDKSTFTFSNRYTCYSKVGDLCNSSSECTKHATCREPENRTNSTCECYENKTNIGGLCFSDYLSDCSSDEDCQIGSQLYCASGVCNCLSGFKFDYNSKMCKVKYGNNCYKNCFGNFVCDRQFFAAYAPYVCKCPSNQYFYSDYEVCLSSCVNDANCNSTLGFSCEDKLCKCNPNEAIYDINFQICKGDIGYPCISGKCSGFNTFCSKYNECLCKNGFKNTHNGECLKGFREICSGSNECHGDFVCDENTCKCDSQKKFDEEKNTCLKIYGYTCINDDDCYGPLKCFNENQEIQETICQCENGTFIDFNNTCENRGPPKLNFREDFEWFNYIWIGGGVGIFIVAVLITISVVLFIRQAAYKKKLNNILSDKEELEFLKGTQKNGDSNLDSIPYDKSFEICSSDIEIDINSILGSGQQGMIYNGRLIKDDRVIDVAVKAAKDTTDKDLLKALLSEIKIMSFIGKHSNIVNFFGAITNNIRNGKLFVIVELCELGSLEHFLRNNNNNFEFGDNKVNCDLNKITFYNLLKWAFECANGMDFLESKNVIHADLAARNLLLTIGGSIKITDFGLSRKLYQNINYLKKTREALPWRWMSIESLKLLEFSSKSDVWSYGILLWEIFTLGQLPYPGRILNVEFITLLESGERPIKPELLELSQENIYGKMCKCWGKDQETRPNFEHLQEFFKNILEKYDSPYEYL